MEKREFKMNIESKFSNKRLKIMIVFIAVGILFGLSVFFESKKQAEANFKIFKNQDAKIQEYLIIQSNTFLPISNPFFEKSEKGEKLIKIVTAYYSVPQETDDEPCIIASGINVCEINIKERKICACPRKYPFGTKFLINGEVWNCQDRLNIKYDDRIDLLFETKEEMKKWGKRVIEVIKLD